ncbi:MAG: hypothetical protein AB7G06_01335 [Bdellovibrionales bacterium]
MSSQKDRLEERLDADRLTRGDSIALEISSIQLELRDAPDDEDAEAVEDRMRRTKSVLRAARLAY